MSKYVVRHGVMRHLGVFSSRGSDTFGRGMQVIARTNRGLELGEVLCEATEQALASMDSPKSGQILRQQTEDDAGELRRLLEQQQEEHKICEQRIAELNLDMRLVDVEHLYGGERVIVYYLSEERVDFRELVKKLASEFQTRIEMRQIGVRDEAKLLADYGDCGKPVCCNTHLSEMPPVSMRMAKLQKATLDPSKISGRCGRLKCCLRYEYDTYQDLQKDLPPVGSDIVTNDGKAKVLAQEILAGRLLVQTEDMRRIVIDGADVLTVIRKGSGGKKKSGSKNSPQSADNTSNRPGSPKKQAPQGDAPEGSPSQTPEKSPPGKDAPDQDG
ncbi:MAG: regulatory iron-sulfur-containing complex subunit RicT [Planctomycetota bacterium]